jgi:hypothetical protein
MHAYHACIYSKRIYMRTPTRTHLCLYARTQSDGRTGGQRDKTDTGQALARSRWAAGHGVKARLGLTAEPLAHLFLILDLVLGDWSFTTRILLDLLLGDLRAVA